MLTEAISARMPLTLPLKVGGNNENIPKLTVWPAAAAPSNATTNLLFVFDAPTVEVVNLKLTLVQEVWAPEIGTSVEAKT
jgi:hypothetical protein